MRLAYLIVAHNNFVHLERLIISLDNGQADFYIHFDKKSEIKHNFAALKNVYILNERFSVNWGGFSIVSATIELLKTAFNRGPYHHYVLLSGADYPIKSTEYISDFFARHHDKNFIDAYQMPLYDKPFSRVDYYHIEGGYKSKTVKALLIRAINIATRVLRIKRKYPQEYKDYNLYAGSQWWAFSGSFVNYLIPFLQENKRFIDFYKHTKIPDEMFFHTIFMNSPFHDTLMGNSLTYTNWSNRDASPSMISERDVKNLLALNNGEKEYLFARKFDDKSIDVINLLDEIR
jgi:hypothetical protein